MVARFTWKLSKKLFFNKLVQVINLLHVLLQVFFVASLNIFQLLIGLDLGFATNFIEQLEKEYGESMSTFTPFIG